MSSSSILKKLIATVGSFRSRTTELAPFEAYQLWSKTYDQIENNALLFAEQSIIEPILTQLSLKQKAVLDAACGTGRYIQIIKRFEPRLLCGVDFSPNMLERAKLKDQVPSQAQFLEASLDRLPFRDEMFDLVLCTLALDHVKNLQRAVGELARVLCTHGSMIISLFHPIGRSLGWKRTFKVDGGQDRERVLAVRYHSRPHSEYMTAFQSSHLRVVQTFEPIIDERLEPFYQKADRLDLYNRFKGHPLLLIFQLEKV